MVDFDFVEVKGIGVMVDLGVLMLVDLVDIAVVDYYHFLLIEVCIVVDLMMDVVVMVD